MGVDRRRDESFSLMRCQYTPRIVALMQTATLWHTWSSYAGYPLSATACCVRCAHCSRLMVSTMYYVHGRLRNGRRPTVAYIVVKRPHGAVRRWCICHGMALCDDQCYVGQWRHTRRFKQRRRVSRKTNFTDIRITADRR